MSSVEKKRLNLPPHPFYFMRHGETDWNSKNIIMGQKDIPLNEVGLSQSHQAIEIVKGLMVERIWSSPLQRARQTAEIINKTLTYNIAYNECLMERGWGQGEGKSHDGFNPDMRLAYGGNEIKEEAIPRGAEPYHDFEARVIQAFEDILSSRNALPPLIISHGGVFRVLTNVVAGETYPLENCAIYLFRPPAHSMHPWFIINIRDRRDQ